MKKPICLYLLFLVIPIILAGCGGSTAPSNNLNVTMTDFTFSPNTFTVPAGGQIAFKGVNNGTVAHSFIIMKFGFKVNDHFTDSDKPNIYWEVTHIAPGQSISDTFTAPSEPGDYQIVCGVGGHFEAGMVAKLVVVKQP